MADTEGRSPNFVAGVMAASSSGLRSDGLVALWANSVTHRLLVDAGTITTSSASAGITGAAVPGSADYIGANSGGNLVGLSYGQNTMANSLPVVLASNQTSIPAPLSSGGLVGQKKIAVTGTAVQLGANTLTNGVIITAKSTNAAPITIGGASVTNTVDGTGNGYILEAGSSASFAITNSNVLYINGTAGDIISFAGS